jgi:glycosyltransferase involved in cell wall biosynthesis
VKIAFIVQRYGAEILGGSEYHCRLIAERIALKHDVDVLTTCARDYITWENHYPEGTDRIRGVTVRRFKNARTRDITAFNQYSDWIFHHPHSREDELSWLEQQGPWCPDLINHLTKHHRGYDALIFFTYLYAPTVLGLQIDPARSILVPTAHDEPAIRLGIYREMFTKPAAVAFNTDVEKNFLKTTFEFRAAAEETVGCGVDLLQDAAQADEPEPEDDEELHKRLDPHLRARGAQFRRRHRLQGQFLLYGGRIDAGKGCEELIEYFTAYKEQGGEAALTLMGVKLMQLPEVPWVRFAGLLSERERLQALEAMAVGTPVLCNARSEVLVDHCVKSNAGLFYSNSEEFIECTKLLLADERLRERMGRNGKEYIKRNYRWDVIMSKYDKLIGSLRR